MLAGLGACLAAVVCGQPPTQCTRGPCAPGNDICASALGVKANVSVLHYHLTDRRGCSINDPNGPFYDEAHRVYHNFYQVGWARLTAPLMSKFKAAVHSILSDYSSTSSESCHTSEIHGFNPRIVESPGHGFHQSVD